MVVAPGPEDEQAWGLALRHLTEGESMDLHRTPGAAVHAAYYAMHHAARAVLLRCDGENAATKHGAVINRFGQIAKERASLDARLPVAGHNLNIAYDQRIDIDYNPRVQPTAAEAEKCLKNARASLAICAEHFGLPSEGFQHD
jgi:uncharacterized protein (UPF0332 family)